MRRPIMVLPRKCPPVMKTAANRPRPRRSAHMSCGLRNATGNDRM